MKGFIPVYFSGWNTQRVVTANTPFYSHSHSESVLFALAQSVATGNSLFYSHSHRASSLEIERR